MSFSNFRTNRRRFLGSLGAAIGVLGLPSLVISAQPKRIALVMVGSIADGGWNQLAYQGLIDLKGQSGFKTAYVENLTQAQIPEVVRGYADDGFDLIIGHGYEFGAAFVEIAPDYPDQSFFATTFQSDTSPLPNLQFADMAYTVVAYAAGALAALASQEKFAVGFVGGGDNPTQQAMNRAFISGAEATVPGIKGLGIVTGDYNNPAKGKEAALAMIGNGADVIWHAADVTGLGVLQGAASRGARVIGCYANQTALAPANMVSSFLMNLHWMVTSLGHSVADGSFAGGTEWAPSLEEAWTPVFGEGDDIKDLNTELLDEASAVQFRQIFSDLAAGNILIDTFR